MPGCTRSAQTQAGQNPSTEERSEQNVPPVAHKLVINTSCWKREKPVVFNGVILGSLTTFQDMPHDKE